jgi:hypothetical protein
MAVLQWPYREWGATAVLSAHDHFYERILVDGLPYFVNGLGGGPVYGFGEPIAGSVARFNADKGAMLIEASPKTITFQFYSVVDGGTLIDELTLRTLNSLTVGLNPLSKHKFGEPCVR